MIEYKFAEIGDVIIENNKEYIVIDDDYLCGGNVRKLYCVKKNVIFKFIRRVYSFEY